MSLTSSENIKSGVITFSSFLATILTLSGVAMGLGNVWRFPYMMGSHGGSAFLLLYLGFVIVFGIPAMAAELSLARTYRGATITVMRHAFGKSGRFLGYLLILCVLIAASFYPLIVAKVAFSAIFSILWGFDDLRISDYQAYLHNPFLSHTLAIVIIWLSLYVIHRGLANGVEKLSKIIVPFFFATAIYLIFITLMQPGAIQQVKVFLLPDFSSIGITEVFAALGQCFYSLGLGGTFILVYGKYIQESTNVQLASGLTAFNDTFASILASLFIVPAVLIFQLELSSGPYLLFDTLPVLFSSMTDGRLFGSFLLIALLLVAFLSVVATFQVLVISLSEEPIGEYFGISKLLILIGLITSTLIVVPASFPEITAIFDLVIGSGFPIFGCLLAVLAVGWRLKRHRLYAELWENLESNTLRVLLGVWIKFVIPALLIVILFGSIFNLI